MIIHENRNSNKQFNLEIYKLEKSVIPSQEFRLNKFYEIQNLRNIWIYILLSFWNKTVFLFVSYKVKPYNFLNTTLAPLTNLI